MSHAPQQPNKYSHQTQAHGEGDSGRQGAARE